MAEAPQTPDPPSPTEPEPRPRHHVFTFQRHRWLRRAFTWGRAPLVNFVRNDGQVYAAAIAFYGIVSLVPLGAVMIAFGGTLLAHLGQGDPEEQAALIADFVHAAKRFIPFLPTGSTQAVLEALVKSRRNIGFIGALALLISASQVLQALRTALNHIFEQSRFKPRMLKQAQLPVSPLVRVWRVFREQASASLAVGALGLLFGGLRYLLTSVLTLARGVAPEAFMQLLHTPVLQWVIGVGSGFLIALVGYCCLLFYLVGKAASWRSILLGGAVFGALSVAAELVYGYYVSHLARLSLTYGSMATLVAVALWVFYSSCVFLICAELTAVTRLWGVPRARLHEWRGR
ncbi:MAG: YihY/virulence factor BrkB family protein [Myxococcota bacterium]